MSAALARLAACADDPDPGAWHAERRGDRLAARAAFPDAGIANRNAHLGPIVRMIAGGSHRLLDGVASVTFDLPILLGIRGEQSPYVNGAQQGLMCITGCCHQSVLNPVDYALEHFEAGRSPHGLYGRLHIAPFAPQSDPQRVTVRTLGRCGVRRIAANRCTGHRVSESAEEAVAADVAPILAALQQR